MLYRFEFAVLTPAENDGAVFKVYRLISRLYTQLAEQNFNISLTSFSLSNAV